MPCNVDEYLQTTPCQAQETYTIARRFLLQGQRAVWTGREASVSMLPFFTKYLQGLSDTALQNSLLAVDRSALGMCSCSGTESVQWIRSKAYSGKDRSTGPPPGMWLSRVKDVL